MSEPTTETDIILGLGHHLEFCEIDNRNKIVRITTRTGDKSVVNIIIPFTPFQTIVNKFCTERKL